MAVATTGTRDTAEAAFSVTSKKRQTFPIEIDGQRYRVKPPKTGLSMKIAIRGKQAEENPAGLVEAIDEWVMSAFGLAQGARIQTRIADDDDDLDIGTLMEVMEKLGEVESGDPTS